uniref:Uncharacterized protein n=1 Tax=Podoviridae sp. ctG4L18 TaxID=2825234 RepID=A0A8S5UNZ5_9CAUD|nr:MAG TPA: hypothetical protein [Podoviridae sp. ctG4L18]
MQYRKFCSKLLMEPYRIDCSIIILTSYLIQETFLMHVLLSILLQMLSSQRFFLT